MLQKTVLASILVSMLFLAPSTYAGKVELTTYYPSPYGEYMSLKSATLDMNGTTTPGVSSAGQGRIYFDSSLNKFQASENGGAFGNLGGGGFKSAQTFTTPGGPYTWTKPAGVTKIYVVLVGGGGGGGTSNTVNGAGGGAGGGCSQGIIDVSAVSNYSVTVGSGGAIGACGSTAPAGTATSFGPMSATGGGGGILNAASSPGIGSGGSVMNIKGGYGPYIGVAGSGGGGGTCLGIGGTGGASAISVATTGTGFGSGGGGSDGASCVRNGAAGAGGAVIVYEY